jgi:peptidoglycan/LPS O-acetylase OafA/YrhL
LTNPKLKYRREIDGLRAVAVLPVILFHAGFEFFRGGFVGVDIFFVISGYLITTLIYQDVRDGIFSFGSFYERRARRILPALYFVLAVSVPFACAWLQPADLRDYFESIFAVSLFSSNILFWTESGYFDAAAELKPLLHTWSLAVEEQYYLLAPIVLVLAGRNRKWLYAIFCSIFILSLAGSWWASIHSPAAGFFLLPTRAWELLIGAFCGLYLARSDVRGFNAAAMQGCSAIGMLLILFAMLTFDKTTPFPGLHALIPTVGAAMVIVFARPSTAVGGLLSSKLLVGLGLISYSAYLWHQPVFSFARHRSLDEPSLVTFGALIIFSMALAYVSWRYVERYFRREGSISPKGVYALSVLGLLGFVSAGYLGHQSIGQQQAPRLAWLDGGELPKKLGGIVVDSVDCSGRDPDKACAVSVGEYDRTLVVIGDSHARGLTQSIGDTLAKYKVRLIDLTSSGCPFLPGLSTFSNGAVFNRCDSSYQEKRLDYLKKLPPATVILMSRFPSYIRGEGFDNTVGGKEIGLSYYSARSNGTALEQRSGEIQSSFLAAIEALVSFGHRVVIIQPVPPTGWNPVSRLLRIEQTGSAHSHEDRDELMRVPHTAVRAWNKPANDIISAAVERFPGVVTVNPESFLCKEEYCSSITRSSVLYADSNHLSLLGNGILFDAVMSALQND